MGILGQIAEGIGGDSKRDILWVFLTDALLLASIGGVIGVLTVIAAIGLIGLLALAIPLELPWTYGAPALFLSLIIGLLAGMVPALRASRLQPLEALRAE